MKIVEIEWEDTYTEVGWGDDDLDTASATSVGYLIKETPDKIVLAGMIGIGYNCKQAIPKGCIKNIKELKGV